MSFIGKKEMVLPHPENNILDNITADSSASFPIFGNRLISEETNYEVVKHNEEYRFIGLQVESYKEEKLYANFKYGTASRTFASVEFFDSGYYIGSCFMTKPRQLCQPDTGIATQTLIRRLMLASVAIPLVSAGGFVPSAWLVAQAPNALNPEARDNYVTVRWISYIVKPSPDVVLRVLYP